MAFETFSTAKMIIQHEWILEDVEEKPKTIASKMILFQGQKVFRVGLKNQFKLPILFFMAIDLNKIGMRVEGVMYGIQDSGIGPAKMTEMTQEVIDKDWTINKDGVLQLFTIELDKIVTGKRTFLFRICIGGSVPGYSYRLSDRLAKDQLWAAAKIRFWADVELVVKGKTFSTHKAILAARSPVFAAEFTTEQPVEGVAHQVRIDGMEPSTVEQFLHFIYTGESMGTLANEELLKLAYQYQLRTLTSLCQTALKKINAVHMANFDRHLNKESEILSSSIIRPEKETEIFFDRTTPTFRCGGIFDLSSNKLPSKCMLKYQNEDIFLAYFTGDVEYHENPGKSYVGHPWFHFLCAKHRNCGLKVEDIYMGGREKGNWFKMELSNFRKNAELLHFTSHSNVYSNNSVQVCFDVKTVSTIDNNYYEMMDDTWMKDFWIVASISQMLTDVEIFVGTVKVMEAHRVILAARSPVLNALLSKISNTGKSIVTFGAEFEVDVVKHFLKFLYTDLLETSASHKDLLSLATTYEVETLKNMCQLANRVPDVEEFTNSLLQL